MAGTFLYKFRFLPDCKAVIWMDAGVYSELVERVKPFPDLLLKAAKMLGGKPEECLFLEDSRAEVEAALFAHMP